MVPTRGAPSLAVAGLACLLIASPAIATAVPCDAPCTVCWKQAQSGLWSKDFNWNSGRVPTPSDLVCIDRDGIYTVTLDIDSEIAGLRVGGASGLAELKVDGVSLRLGGDAEIRETGALTVIEGAVEGARGVTLTNTSEAVFEGATRVGGRMVNDPRGVVEVRATPGRGDALLTVGEALSNRGEVRLSNLDSSPRAVAIEVVGGPLENLRQGSITSLGASGGERRIVGGLVNDGELRVSGGSLLLDGSAFDNDYYGSVVVEQGALEVRMGGAARLAKAAPQFSNSGSIALGQGSRVTIRGGSGRAAPDSGPVAKAVVTFVNFGSITTAEDSQFIVIGLGFLNDGGLLGGDGAFDLTQATSSANDGIVAPGQSPGWLRIAGDLECGPASRLQMELWGPVPGYLHDRLEVTGQLALGGTLQGLLGHGYLPAPGDRFVLATSAGLSGELAELALPVMGFGREWQLASTATTVELAVVCRGPRLQLAATGDKDPVSLGYPELYSVTVANPGDQTATGVVVRDSLPASLRFLAGQSSADCQAVGGDVECAVGVLPPGGQRTFTVAAEPVSAGQVTNPFELRHTECIADPTGYSSSVTVRVTSAPPCDATDDGQVATDDLPAAVGHLFGEPAPGNPDCAPGDGVNAADLARALVEVTGP